MPEALKISAHIDPAQAGEEPGPGQPLARLVAGRSIDCSETVSEYISGTDWRIKANANVGYSQAGLVSNVAGKVIANFWLDAVYRSEERRLGNERLRTDRSRWSALL